jgi:hypothetical protein
LALVDEGDFLGLARGPVQNAAGQKINGKHQHPHADLDAHLRAHLITDNPALNIADLRGVAILVEYLELVPCTETFYRDETNALVDNGRDRAADEQMEHQ